MKLSLVLLTSVVIAVALPAAAEPAADPRSAPLAPHRAAKSAAPATQPAPNATPAKPATPPPEFAAMTVSIVRSAKPGCEPNCPEWIAAEGMIDQNTLPQFKKILRTLGPRKLPILIDSGGGVVDDSLVIGRLIRAKGLDVIVAKTLPQPCRDVETQCKSGKIKGVMPALAVNKLAKCASSCAFILAGGQRRIVGPYSFVGVHQLKTLRTTAQVLQRFRIERQLIWGVPTETRRTLISEKLVNKKTSEAKTPDSAYVKVAKYFNEMGVGDAIMPILKSTPNSSIHWLTRSQLQLTGMATNVPDIDDPLQSGGPFPAAQPQVPQAAPATNNSTSDALKIGPLPNKPASPTQGNAGTQQD